MKRIALMSAISVLTVVFLISFAQAGPPFNNLEGVGGVAFNPLAYLADSEGSATHIKINDVDVVGAPRLGGWYVSLGDVDVDWTTIGIADTFFKRLEISYGYETINQANVNAKHKNNLGGKLLLLPENAFDTKFIPAVSIGGILKHTSNVGVGVDASSVDYYLVATKLVTQLPRPLLLSAGALSTEGKATGVFGYDKDRKTIAFGNIDVVLPGDFIAGFEFKQGARYPDWKDANYWDAHVAWAPNKNLTFILAYVDAGNHKSSNKTGLGQGVVLSAQYAF
ncbi:MAG: DUF3034 family protein [Candidatus Omnitrophota bacterium]